MSPATSTPARPLPLADTVRIRSSWDDAIERDDEMLVLAGSDVTLLSPMGTEAVLASRHGTTLGELRDHLVREFGAPSDGDADAAVQDLVRTLVARGVMTLSRDG